MLNVQTAPLTVFPMVNWEDVNSNAQHGILTAEAQSKSKYTTLDTTRSFKRYWSNAKIAKMAKLTYRKTNSVDWLAEAKASPAEYTHYFRIDSICATSVNKDIYLGTFEYCYYTRFRGQVFTGEIV